jgi:hypothetical protein
MQRVSASDAARPKPIKVGVAQYGIGVICNNARRSLRAIASGPSRSLHHLPSSSGTKIRFADDETRELGGHWPTTAFSGPKGVA